MQKKPYAAYAAISRAVALDKTLSNHRRIHRMTAILVRDRPGYRESTCILKQTGELMRQQDRMKIGDFFLGGLRLGKERKRIILEIKKKWGYSERSAYRCLALARQIDRDSGE